MLAALVETQLAEFTNFIQDFTTKSSCDSVRKMSNALKRLQHLVIHFSNSNIDDIGVYMRANPHALDNFDDLLNQPSTFTSAPLPPNPERAQFQVANVRKRSRSDSINNDNPRINLRRCPFCSDLCTMSTALMWLDCNHCHLPVHFKCDENFLFYNPYICTICRNAIMS